MTLTMVVNSGSNNTQSTQTVTVPAGATSFTFPTAIALAASAATYSAYEVAVTTQPTGAGNAQSQTCVPLNAYGFIHASSNVTNVQVTCLANAGSTLQGVYQLYQNGAATTRWLAFGKDGTYVFGAILNDTTCNNNGNGVDYGAYTWNATTGALQVLSAQVYSLAPCGLTNATGVVSSNNFVLTSAGGGANSVLTLVNNGNIANAVTLVPVPSTAASLVGAFVFGGSLDQGLNIFTSDGHYVNINTQADAYSGALAGIEYGCYTAANGTLSTDTTSACAGAVETAGTDGFSGGTATTVSIGYATPDATTANFIFGGYTFSYERFAASAPRVTPPTGGVTVGGSITGLSAAGSPLTLQLVAINGSNNTQSTQTLTVAPGATSFTFPTGIALATAPTQYEVMIAAQPTGPNQTCVATNAYGEISSATNITSVVVSCIANPTSPLQGFYQAFLDAAGTQPQQSWLVFSPNGSYIFATIGNNSSCAENGDGVDFGVYKWNPTTGALVFEADAVNSLAPCGFTINYGAVDTTVTRTLTRSGTGSATVLKLVTVGGTVSTLYLRPVPVTTGIVGAFAAGAGLDQGLVVFGNVPPASTAYSGYYLIVNPQTDATTGTGSIAGLEYGCYTAAGGSITIDTTTACPGVVLTAGAAGFSGGAAITNAFSYALPAGNDLQIILGTYTFPYARFLPN